MADSQVDDLTALATPAMTDIHYVIGDGTNDRKATTLQIRNTDPTLPTIVSVGAEFTSTAAPTATLPGTHAANDILVLCLQSSNQDLATPAGYARIGPQNGIGATVTAGSTRLGIFWKRDGGSEVAPTIADSGDHTYGFMFAIRGCVTTGDPFHFLGNTMKEVASTSFSGPKGATTIDNMLITIIAAHAVDNASGQAGAATNADLTSITESFDDGTTDGTGGGITLISATKASAGSIGATTWTWSNSTVDISSLIAWIPSDAAYYEKAARPPESMLFIGSAAAIADTWVKPTGARRVHVQAVGGGGGGGGGRNAATAEGGGGGGGGHYQEKWFDADDLGATVALTPGNGGAATANSDGASGNNGANSTFGSGPTLVKAVAGRAGAGAASAVGGAGGAGGGLDAAPAAGAATTVFGSQSARGGGAGGTAPIQGSAGEYGGGGGEAGADTDAGSTPGGSSQFGGGGGSSGRAAGTVSSAGAGGGAASPTATAGTAGNDGVRGLGGSGGIGGNSTTAAGRGGRGGGGGGGGGTASGSQRGERGGHGTILVTTFFT